MIFVDQKYILLIRWIKAHCNFLTKKRPIAILKSQTNLFPAKPFLFDFCKIHKVKPLTSTFQIPHLRNTNAPELTRSVPMETQGEFAADSAHGRSSRPRLFIREMVMRNFKSYAGEQRVGPFHKVRVFHFLIFNFENF